MTDCEKYEELISLHIDGETTVEEEAALHAHLEVCPDCTALLASYAEISRLLADETEPPEELVDNVMNTVRVKLKEQKKFKTRRIVFRVAAMAAVLALVLIPLANLPNLMQKDSYAEAEGYSLSEAPMAVSAQDEAAFATGSAAVGTAEGTEEATGGGAASSGLLLSGSSAESGSDFQDKNAPIGDSGSDGYSGGGFGVSGAPSDPDAASGNDAPADPGDFSGSSSSPECAAPANDADTREQEPGASAPFDGMSGSVPFEAQIVRTDGDSDAFSSNAAVVSSREALEAYIERNQENYYGWWDGDGNQYYYSLKFYEVCDGYDSAFFAENQLVILTLEEGSGSIGHRVDSVEQMGDGVIITVCRILPGMGTCDMAGWHIFVEIPQGTVEAAENVQVEYVIENLFDDEEFDF